jgi:ADP-heptose:LPS heptosyltransferase
LSPRDGSRTDPSRFRKVLLIRLRRIGDIILTTPAVRALRTALPRAELVYVVEEPYRKLVEGNPDIDRVVTVPKGQSRREFLALVRAVRKEGYDAVVDFHGGPRASLLAFLSGGKVKAGYAVKHRGVFYDVRVPRAPKEGRIHSVENHVNLVRALGIEVGEVPGLVLPRSSGGALTRDVPQAPFLVLHVGAGNRFRYWGADNLVRLVRLIGEIPGTRAVLIGGPEDRAAEAEILEKVPGTQSYVASLDLAGTAELIRRATVFVGPDSGPMHIAAAVGTPIVAWFGPTLPANFAPWKPAGGARIIEKALDCRPCRQRTCVHGDFRCLQLITPEEVRDQVTAALGPSSGGLAAKPLFG